MELIPFTFDIIAMFVLIFGQIILLLSGIMIGVSFLYAVLFMVSTIVRNRISDRI